MKIKVKRTNFSSAVNNMFQAISDDIGDFSFRIKAYLAGGAAIHIYTQHRVSKDVDAILSHSIPLRELYVYYNNPNGQKCVLSYDLTYNPTLGLIHPDYEKDSKRLWAYKKLDLNILCPLDLAVTKIGRFNPIDRKDILELANHRLINSADLNNRAIEALDYFIGDSRFVNYNIKDAVKLVKGICG